MKTWCTPVLLCALLACGWPSQATEQAALRSHRADDMPFVFAGLKYGATEAELIQRFGPPARREAVAGAEYLYWADDQLRVTLNRDTRLVASFQVTGAAGVAAVRRVQDEPALWFLSATQDELIRLLGSPTKIWYGDRRMSWEIEVDPKVQASIFLECLRGRAKTCDTLAVNWSGRAIWDPHDGVDALGLRTHPICAFSTSAIRILGKQAATGQKAVHAEWELEVFENPSSGSWSLVGRSSAAKAPKGGRFCYLAQGGRNQPYRSTRWFSALFKP